MGIRGLKTYMNNNSNFLEDHKLCNSYIVIDGLSLASHLFFSSNHNFLFGGDYDIYANCVSDFFDEFHKSEITPLVILDGGMESKKLETIFKRKQDVLEAVLQMTTGYPQLKINIGGMILQMVFASVLKRKQVKIVRCPLEADSSIAGVAKTLGCPVLSLDSDFYVFGVNYIPTDSLLPFVEKNSWGRGFVRPCKIFRPQFLLRSFPGFDSSVLPLAAALLGNDYVKSTIFKDFYATLRLSDQSTRLRNPEQRKIDATLRWLRNYNLNDAVAEILGKVPKKKRRDVLDAIEMTVDEYQNPPNDMLLPLGFKKQHEAEKREKGNRKTFSFQEDISTLQSTLSWRSGRAIVANEITSSEEETDDERSFITSSIFDYPGKCIETFVNSWPNWFKYHYTNADFPASFVDMMFHRAYLVSVQIEDFNYPSPHEISLKIVGVIDGLLVAGRQESAIGLLYIIREGTKFVHRRVDTVRGTRSTIFPALCDLRDAPMSMRQQIFNDTLEIAGIEKLINDIPSEWRLYIATALYWIRQEDEPSRNWLHMQALLFTMLLGVLDQKIEHCRTLWLFNKKYGKTLAEIESKQKCAQPVISENKNESILDAIKAVTVRDCLLAARFFISSCSTNPPNYDFPWKCNVTIVHAFVQFQSCLKPAIDLNSLLGLSYETPVIGELYNGTMLYNVYTAFAESPDVDSYIKKILEKSPSLLHLLNRLTAKVKEMLSTVEDKLEFPVEDKLDEATA